MKIRTAALICLAFIFRLLFVNISLLPVFNTSETNASLTKHFNTIQKRRRAPETSHSATKEYTVVEVCEEDSDSEEDSTKVSSPVILSIFYSFLQQIIPVLRPNNPFDLIKCHLQPRRYLALSTLRI